jgi:hypothetical protein
MYVACIALDWGDHVVADYDKSKPVVSGFYKYIDAVKQQVKKLKETFEAKKLIFNPNFIESI